MRTFLLSLLGVVLLTGCQFLQGSDGLADEPSAEEPTPEDGVVIDFPDGERTADDGTDLTEGYVKLDGRMMVYRDGVLRPLLEETTLDNGQMVFLDGTVQMSDQTLLQLNDGEMVTMDGELRTSVDVRGVPVQQADVSDADIGSRYMAYREGVIGNGSPSVLFFHATWCPSCKADDAKLREWDEAGVINRTVYKVDYDTSEDLLREYGVVNQHTYVVLDGEGEAMDVVNGPTEAQLRTLLDI